MRHQPTVVQEAAPNKGSHFLCWQPAQVVDRRRAGDYAVVELVTEHRVRAGPGQFIMARTAAGPVLSRPLSVLRCEGSRLAFLVKAEGMLRSQMANAPLGTRFQLRGPYGVPYRDAIPADRKYVLVGGGTGIAPLCFFQEQHPELVEATVFGFRRAEDAEVLSGLEVLIEELGQGTAGAEALRKWKPGQGLIACGPEAMLRQLATQLPDRSGVYVALEQRMGCAYGACQGCVVLTKDGPCRLCKEGPLVALERLLW